MSAPAADVAGVEQAYTVCEQITRTQARNFAYGIRLLPAPKRRAMSAVYALARRIDDIGDGDLPTDEKSRRLEEVRRQVARLAGGARPDPADPVMVAVDDATRRYRLPLDAFGELVDGCLLDARGVRYARFDELVGYCRLVAGTIGRLSLAVFAADRCSTDDQRAETLGVALQLTNILRDVVEDRDQMGRVYLPAEDAVRFGCRPDLSGPPDALAALIGFEAARTERWYTEGLPLATSLDRRSRACLLAMAGIYHRLLQRIHRDPAAVLTARLSLPAWHKAWVAGRALAS
jgi:phytoene synthase